MHYCPKMTYHPANKKIPDAFMFVIALCAMLLFVGCKPLQINPVQDRVRPSNDRNWIPEMAVLPFAHIDSGMIHLKNIRNCQYLSSDDYVVDHYDRSFAIEDVQSVDFIVVPFNSAPALAHTMLSFGLGDGSYLGVSVEVRKEIGENYSPLAGIARQFEIGYVVADERDLIRVRTRHRDSSVYVYPTVATPEQAQRLLLDVLQRVNNLAAEPEFYNTIVNNCTTNLAEHVNRLDGEKIAYSWRVLLPGFSAEYAYELGLLNNNVPFEDLSALALVNDLAEAHFDDPDFSRLIRSKRRLLTQAKSPHGNSRPAKR